MIELDKLKKLYKSIKKHNKEEIKKSPEVVLDGEAWRRKQKSWIAYNLAKTYRDEKLCSFNLWELYYQKLNKFYLLDRVGKIRINHSKDALKDLYIYGLVIYYVLHINTGDLADTRDFWKDLNMARGPQLYNSDVNIAEEFMNVFIERKLPNARTHTY